MPRDGSGIYTKPYPNVVSGTTIESTVHNGTVSDIETDLNAPRPIIAGGTGASSADDALKNISGEKAAQLVASYDTHLWFPGSFRSAAAAAGAPNATAAFAGIAYINEVLATPPTNQNVVLEARDLTDGVLYVRRKTAGTWGVWETERQTIAAAPFDALAYNGMQINGSMNVSQQNGPALTISAGGGADTYIVDGWIIAYSKAGASITGQQAGGPGGGIQSVEVKAATAITAPTGGEYAVLRHKIEGYRAARLAFGTGPASSLTIGFWVFASITGTMGVSLHNATVNRNIVSNVTINAAATWEWKTVTFPGDTTGTWITDNGNGLYVDFCCANGTTFVAATPNVWGALFILSTLAQTNFLSTNGNRVNIGGVIVLPGMQAPTAAQSPTIMRPYDQELMTCQRYYRQIKPEGAGIANGTTSAIFGVRHLAMRVIPTISQAGLINISDIYSSNYTQSAASLTNIGSDIAYGTYQLGNYSGLTNSRVYMVLAANGNIVLDARL